MEGDLHTPSFSGCWMRIILEDVDKEQGKRIRLRLIIGGSGGRSMEG